MIRSGRRYKIGFTNSPNRRFREVRIELPDPTHIVHTIETDDPAGIEGYWHCRFASKRVRDTEFFELDSGDVAAFKRRKYQ
ncbi:MAG: GIY-YIG nuclease family protein [Steroidobacteraceae bacterium]